MIGPKPLTLAECRQLKDPRAFRRAVELGYVRDHAEYEQARADAQLEATSATLFTVWPAR